MRAEFQRALLIGELVDEIPLLVEREVEDLRGAVVLIVEVERVARGLVGVFPIGEAQVLHVHLAGGTAVCGEEMPFSVVEDHRGIFERDIGIHSVFGGRDERR